MICHLWFRRCAELEGLAAEYQLAPRCRLFFLYVYKEIKADQMRVGHYLDLEIGSMVAPQMQGQQLQQHLNDRLCGTWRPRQV